MASRKKTPSYSGTEKDTAVAKRLGDRTPDLLQGTLDLLILRTVQGEPMHGWAISRHIQQVSGDVLIVQQGSLYPSLHRLERRGWIAASWGVSENNRKAKFYRLTDVGRRQLASETESWHQLSAAVTRVLEMA